MKDRVLNHPSKFGVSKSIFESVNRVRVLRVAILAQIGANEFTEFFRGVGWV